MDVLKHKTVTGADGFSSVNVSIPLSQIVKISRQGEQKDYVPIITPLDGNQWTFIPRFKRVVFSTSIPFVGAEVIHVIYKETL